MKMNPNFEVALLRAYVSLVKLLHDKKVIDINDLLASIGNTIDFANTEHMHDATQKELLVIYRHIEQIAAAMHHAESKPPE